MKTIAIFFHFWHTDINKTIYYIIFENHFDFGHFFGESDCKQKTTNQVNQI